MEVKPYKIPHPFRKLSKDLIDKIVGNIAQGSTHRYSAESNGITETIFNIWRRQGICDLEHEVDSLCSYLVVSLAKTKQSEVIQCRTTIKSDERSHKGAEWTLEHAYQKDFSTSQSIREIQEDVEHLKEALYGRQEVDSKSD